MISYKLKPNSLDVFILKYYDIISYITDKHDKTHFWSNLFSFKEQGLAFLKHNNIINHPIFNFIKRTTTQSS